MNLIIFLALVAVIIVLIAETLVIVPANYFGIRIRLGNRVPNGVVREGINWKIPFIEVVEVFSLELVETEVSAKFTTLDNLELEVRGDLQYRPDPQGSDETGRNVFYTISDEIIKKGIAEAIQSLLGSLGGRHDHTTFIQGRQVIKDMVNCILRMDSPPHMDHDKEKCGIEGCVFQKRVDVEQILEFYQKHWQKIRPLVEEEAHPEEEGCTHINEQRSATERRYGINIVYFAIPSVGFSPETKKALEEKKQAELRQAAGKIRVELMREFIGQGMTPKDAADQADLVLDNQVHKTIVSGQGDLGVLTALLSRKDEKK